MCKQPVQELSRTPWNDFVMSSKWFELLLGPEAAQINTSICTFIGRQDVIAVAAAFLGKTPHSTP